MFNINKVTFSPITTSFLLFSCISCFANSAESHGLVLNSKVTIAQDDNILKNSNQIEDQYISLEPIASFNSFIGKHDIAIEYQGKINAYSDYSNFNYFDHNLSSSLNLNHSSRAKTEIVLNYQNIIEEPNTTNGINFNLTEFTQIVQKGLDASFIYGTDDSMGQIKVGYGFADKNFNNNEQSFRDLSQHLFNLSFYYRLSPELRLLLLGSINDLNYKNNLSRSQSSQEYSLLTGITWQTTANTSGTLRVGYQTKKFDSDLFKEINGLTYELDLIWTPQTFTTINLGSSRAITESALINESAYETTSYYINASHDFSKRTSFISGYTLDKSDIQGRTDEIKTFEIGLTHNIRKWLDISLLYNYEEKKSINSLFNYNANIIQLSFETIFE